MLRVNLVVQNLMKTGLVIYFTNKKDLPVYTHLNIWSHTNFLKKGITNDGYIIFYRSKLLKVKKKFRHYVLKQFWSLWNWVGGGAGSTDISHIPSVCMGVTSLLSMPIKKLVNLSAKYNDFMKTLWSHIWEIFYLAVLNSHILCESGRCFTSDEEAHSFREHFQNKYANWC